MQDYKMVVRSVWAGATTMVAGEIVIQNFNEAIDYLNEIYLGAGYKVLSVDFLGELPVNELEQSNSPRALRYAWHLVKDVK